MKKSLLLMLTSCFVLSGCAFLDKITAFFKPNSTNNGEEVPFEEVPFDQPKDTTTTCTYQFFLSYSHTSRFDPVLNAEVATPLYVLKDVPMLLPLGALPEEINTKDKILALADKKGFVYDPAFDTFLGFSHSTICLDEEGLWDFSKDYRQLATINLYGVWVSE